MLAQNISFIMDNIIEILKKYITTDVVKHLMATLGESEIGVSRGVETAMPTVLAQARASEKLIARRR